MSIQAVWWVTASAPVASPQELALLAIMAGVADADGCSAFRRQKWYAKRTRMSDRTVRRALDALEERRVIQRGDQSLVKHIPISERPVVWDLQIPFSWFKDIEEINDYREGRNRPPLTPEMRPDLDPAPEPKKRADAGRKKKPGTDSDGDDPDYPDTDDVGDDLRDAATEAEAMAAGGSSSRTSSPPGLQVRSTNSRKPDSGPPDLKSGPDFKSAPPGLEVRTPRTSSPTKDTVLEPILEPVLKDERSTSLSARPDDSEPPPGSTAGTVQPTLDGSEPERPPTDAELNSVAFGVARGWVDWRREQQVPVVMRSPKSDPVVVVKNLVLPALKAGYSEREVKIVLGRWTGGIPSASQLDRVLSEARMGQGNSGRRAANVGPMSGANRHIDDLTAAQRDAQNPFLIAVRSSDVPDEPGEEPGGFGQHRRGAA